MLNGELQRGPAGPRAILVPMASERPSSDSWARFLLTSEPTPGGLVELEAEEARHAQKVLRLQPGARALGLDGRGRAWPLVAERGPSRQAPLLWRAAQATEQEPAPGEPGAPLPTIEIALAWPRPGREEALIERLTQLGVARIQPLLAKHTGPEQRRGGGPRAERLLLQALKQCRRLWVPELRPPLAPLAVPPVEGLEVVLDPRADLGLVAALEPWARAVEVPTLRLWIGPEGGFSDEETEHLAARGVRPARLGPHILRIETAAEAGAAVALALFEAGQRPRLGHPLEKT